MVTKQIISFCFACLLSIAVIGQVNNIIFLGGNGNGSTLACFQSISNNRIYSGGFFNGYYGTCVIKEHQNLIFAGGYFDGSSMTWFIATTNNPVFAGGNEDGSGLLCYQTITNNLIYAGGYFDGNAQTLHLLPSSNPIFAGNTGDGYDSKVHALLTNNSIFAGNTGDGYNKGLYTINIPTLIWHGQYSSNWYNKFNWDQIRIPTIEDHVIINTEKFDPELVKGKLGIGEQSPSLKEYARNVSILNGSTLFLDKTSISRIRKTLDVYGSLVSYNQSVLPVIVILPGGRVTIYGMGNLHIFAP